MVKKLRVAPFSKEIILAKPDDLTTALIYYGGKSRDAQWVIDHFPPHRFYVEVFGGGGAVFFNKPKSETDIYNDFGNVAVFWKVVRQWPEELYERLFWTPYSRTEFEECSRTWEEYARRSKQTGNKEDYLEFARRWFVQINISFTHREDDPSFKVATQVNNGVGFANHVDMLPWLSDRLRSSMVEHLHFRDCIAQHDRSGTLFYSDPPYLPDTRVSNGTYRVEMTVDEHVELLDLLCNCKGQVVLSGYESKLYDERLKDWRVVTKSALSAIQNRSQLEGRGMRKEKLWIKEDSYGLWAYLEDQSQADVAELPDQGLDLSETLLLSE